MSGARPAPPAPQSLIAARGARATRTRVQTLGTLLAAHEALTHHEIERRVARSHDVDRVTLYRVLEWLVGQGLAHKIAGEDRVWRYSAAGHAQGPWQRTRTSNARIAAASCAWTTRRCPRCRCRAAIAATRSR